MFESVTNTSPIPLLVGGKEVQLDDTFDVFNPATGELLYKCSNIDVAQSLQAVDAGAHAFESWSQTSPVERRKLFLKVADILDQRSLELKGYMTHETGCDEAWADFNLYASKGHILDCAGRLATVAGSIPSLEDPSVGAMVVNEPYGVILAMAPWNAPYVLGFRSVIWAIAAGNTVVLKGSELSPRCYWAISSVFQDAGLPSGVLNYIACSPGNAPDVVKAIIASPKIKKINFTGSTSVGRIIGQLAGANLKPLLLELGGKAPAIVCDDADLDIAAKECVVGAFLHAGQICMSTERILVHKSVRDQLEQKLNEWVSRIFPLSNEAPVLISDAAATKNKNFARDAVGKGAALVCGGDFESHVTSTRRLRPIIISNVKPGMDIYKHESFGPSVSLIEFETTDEALRIANDTEYGLSSAIFSKDLRKALRLAKRIETGAVHINCMTVQDEPILPHGGAKASGYGRFNASLGEWLRTKNITYNV